MIIEFVKMASPSKRSSGKKSVSEADFDFTAMKEGEFIVYMKCGISFMPIYQFQYVYIRRYGSFKIFPHWF